MKIFVRLFTILALLPACAHAQPAPESQGAGGLSSFCRQMQAYTDTSAAAYKPGVDVHGKAVAPADVGASIQGEPQAANGGDGKIYIPVQVDLLSRFGVNAPAGAELKPEVALLAVGRDGSVEYNGRRLGAQAQAACAGQDAAAPDALPGNEPLPQAKEP